MLSERRQATMRAGLDAANGKATGGCCFAFAEAVEVAQDEHLTLPLWKAPESLQELPLLLNG